MLQSSMFQITALIAGAVVSKTMRIHGRIEDIQRTINEAIPEADSITIEHVDAVAFQNDRRRNRGYDIACHTDDVPVCK